MTTFLIGTEYSHASIVSAFGGDQISYLPQQTGRIVCGRFKVGDMNPNAPYEVLVGDLPRVRQKAELLSAQTGSIPVFLKEGTSRWRYHGQMRCVSYAENADEIRRVAGKSLRIGKIAGILRLVDVQEPETERSSAASIDRAHNMSSAQPNKSMVGTVARSLFTIVVWVVALGAAVTAGVAVGIGSLLATAFSGRRRRYRRRVIW